MTLEESSATIKICCHGCDEFHEFDRQTGSLVGKPLIFFRFFYTCTIGTAYMHGPLEELHELTDGTYADPEQWYKFPKELWGSYQDKTKGYSEKTGDNKIDEGEFK